MRLLALRAGLMGCLIFVTSTHAAPAEKLITEVPKHWVKTLDRRLGNLHLVEYYPPGPAENWTEKLTIEVLSTPTPGDPLQHAQALADTQRNQCAPLQRSWCLCGHREQLSNQRHIATLR